MSGPMRLLALITLLAAALLGPLVTPLSAATAGSGLTFTLEAGFEGRAKSGQWIPVTATVVNEGQEWSGRLQFTTVTEIGPNRHGSNYRFPLVVPAGATKQISFYMPAEIANMPAVQLVADDGVVAEAVPQVQMTWEALVGVLGVEPADLPTLAGLQLGQRTVRLIRLTGERLPDEPLALQSLDAILLDRLAWAELPAPRQQALQTWVEHGGTLILGGGPEIHRLEPLYPWLGISAPALAERAVTGVGTASLITVSEKAWLVTRREGDSPLVYSQTRGAGEIHLLAFDPALEPFASWQGLPGLMAQVLHRSAELTTTPISGPPATKIGINVGDLIRQMPIKEVPSTRRLLIILGVYALVMGPVHLLLLRGLRRLGWALLTLPLLSLAGAGTTYAYMKANVAADVSAISLGVIEGQPGGHSLAVRSLTGFYLPPGSSHTAEIGGALLSSVPALPLPTPGIPYKPATGRSVIDQGRSVRLEPLNEWLMRSVVAEGTQPVAGTVDGAILVDGQYITGRVTNRLPFTLKGAAIMAGPNFQELGDLAPGASVDVSVVLPAFSGGMGWGANRVGEVLGRMADPGMIGPDGLTAEQQQRVRRQQLAWALTGALPWADALEQPKVLIAGWLETAGLPVLIDGQEVEPTAESLYVQRMTYGYSDGAFQLSADLVPGRLIDSTVGTNQPVQWGWGMAKNMSATLEHVVPIEIIDRVTGMEWRIPILEKGPASEEDPFQVSAFRWRDQSWVKQPFAPEGFKLSPADGFLSPDGRVRIRLDKLNDATLVLGAPGLSVSGEEAAP